MSCNLLSQFCPIFAVNVRGVRDDIEQEDVEEAYYRYMEENPMAGVLADEQEDLNVQYDNEGNIIYVEKNKVSLTNRHVE